MTVPDLSQPALTVAPLLLGCLVRCDAVAIRLTEVEAYEGTLDPASHAFRGPTARNAVMYGPSGRLYVYLSYGLHHAVNIVCGAPGTASAVLLRAGEVVTGIETVRARRGDLLAGRLARGPGNLGACLGVTTADSGLVLGAGRVALDAGPGVSWVSGPRVGVSAAADRPWRFWIPGDPTVSAYRRSARAPSPRKEPEEHETRAASYVARDAPHSSVNDP